jgi:hypothetical protein
VRAYRSHVSGAVTWEAGHRRDRDPDRSVVGVSLAAVAALPALVAEVTATGFGTRTTLQRLATISPARERKSP